MIDTKSVITTSIVMTASGTNTSGAQASPKKTVNNQTNKSQKPRKKSTHPRTAEMVTTAIKTLKERGGSSLQAIKKYISTTYKIDVEKQAPFIKKYLKSAVSNGGLIQTKGKGAAGSFKLSVGKPVISKLKKKSVTKAATPLKKSVAAVKKQQIVKKPTRKVVKQSPKKVAIPEKRKVIKGPAAKPPKVKSAAKVKVGTKSTPKKAPVVRKVASKTKVVKPSVKAAKKSPAKKNRA